MFTNTCFRRCGCPDTDSSSLCGCGHGALLDNVPVGPAATPWSIPHGWRCSGGHRIRVRLLRPRVLMEMLIQGFNRQFAHCRSVEPPRSLLCNILRMRRHGHKHRADPNVVYVVFHSLCEARFEPSTALVVSHNLGSETKKATGMPLYMSIGHCGSILGSHLFPMTEAPRYV